MIGDQVCVNTHRQSRILKIWRFLVTTKTQEEWQSPTAFWKRHNRHEKKFGRNLMYDWLSEGKLPHVRIGRKILIPADAFERMLKGE